MIRIRSEKCIPSKEECLVFGGKWEVIAHIRSTSDTMITWKMHVQSVRNMIHEKKKKRARKITCEVVEVFRESDTSKVK